METSLIAIEIMLVQSQVASSPIRKYVRARAPKKYDNTNNNNNIEIVFTYFANGHPSQLNSSVCVLKCYRTAHLGLK